MFDHPIIDVVLGLVFFYVVFSLVASAIQEWIASLFALRSKNLWAGVKTLISEEYAKRVYAHPLIDNLAKKGKMPSYISPDTLTTVLLHVIAKKDDTTSGLASQRRMSSYREANSWRQRRNAPVSLRINSVAAPPK